MDQISRFIEDEIERRVNERLTSTLEKISRTYDISLRQLLRDIHVSEPSWDGNVCHGITKTKQKCKRGVKDGSGYCMCHRDQRPPQRIPVMVRPVSSVTLNQHTHTLPPMFLAGCPACEQGRSLRIEI